VNAPSALLQKVARYLRSAELLVRDGDLDSAASRLYYAMLYLAETLLDTRGIRLSSHQALISAYGQQFAKTGELDPRFHRALITAFNRRRLGDYLAPSGLTVVDIEDMRADAEDFLAATKRYLKVS
jgi:uncharacterized protein (UPF0332 family)